MLHLNVNSAEFFDEATETFIETKPIVLNLEHSLLSISKWESKYHKPFLAKNKQDVRTKEEMIDYVKCMTLNHNVPDIVYRSLNKAAMDKVYAYINDPMTATTITESSDKKNEIITSEVIYYWMVSLGIPFSCEKWHLNRLITLVKVCNAMNNPKKMSRKDILSRNRALNAARKKALHTRG